MVLGGEARDAKAPAPIRAAKLTIEEVGRLAGVSRNTVSLALANSPRVRPETRERVLRVVAETGYRRNQAAAALAGGASRTVGVLEFGTPAYLSERAYLGYLAGIEEETSSAGYDLLLLSARRKPGPGWLLSLARTRRVDALVLLGAETDREAVAELLAAGAPVVHVGRRAIPGHDLAYVTPDYLAAGALAVRRLASRGVRAILHVSVDRQLESRLDLFRGVCEEAARLAHGTAVARAEPASLDAALDALPAGARPGVVIHGTTTAVQAWRATLASRPSVHVVAYDDEGWLGEVLPGVDALIPRKGQIGRAAARLALELAAKRQPAAHHVAIPPEATWQAGVD